MFGHIQKAMHLRVLFLAGGRRHWFFCSSKWSFGFGIWCCHNISSWYGFPNTGWWPFFYLTDFFYMTLMSFFIFQALLLVLNHCTNMQSGWSLRAPILSSELQACSFISFSITVHSCSSLQFVNAIPYVQASSVIYLHTIREHIRLSNN